MSFSKEALAAARKHYEYPDNWALAPSSGTEKIYHLADLLDAFAADRVREAVEAEREKARTETDALRREWQNCLGDMVRAVEEEREACAKICEAKAEYWRDIQPRVGFSLQGERTGAAEMATAIRARGTTK